MITSATLFVLADILRSESLYERACARLVEEEREALTSETETFFESLYEDEEICTLEEFLS